MARQRTAIHSDTLIMATACGVREIPKSTSLVATQLPEVATLLGRVMLKPVVDEFANTQLNSAN